MRQLSLLCELSAKQCKGEQDSQIWMPTRDSFWIPNEIHSWNFQHMHHIWFREASQNLSSFRQLFFHSFQGGTKGKMLKNCQNYTLVFQHFSFGPPLGNYEKKVVWMSSNFERLHEIKNEAYAENFSCLSHWEVRNPHPLYNLGTCWTSPLQYKRSDPSHVNGFCACFTWTFFLGPAQTTLNLSASMQK